MYIYLLFVGQLYVNGLWGKLWRYFHLLCCGFNYICRFTYDNYSQRSIFIWI